MLASSTSCLCFQAECYHYLFDAAIKLHQLGLDWTTPNHGPIQNVKGVSGSGGIRNVSVEAGAAGSNQEFEPLRVSRYYVFSFPRFVQLLLHFFLSIFNILVNFS